MDHQGAAAPLLLSGQPAPYGYSCARCSQSKRKCIVGSQPDGPCERCLKMHKQCLPAKTVRSRMAVDRRDRRKMLRPRDDLPSPQSPSNNIVGSPLYDSVCRALASARLRGPDRTHFENRSGLRCFGSGDSHGIHSSAQTPIYSTPNTTTSIDLVSGANGGGEPSQLEAEDCLTSFQTLKLKYFPFMYISPTTSARSLRQERPFLWLCIVAVSSRSASLQVELGVVIRQILAQEMVLQSEKNIDLLLGLLTFIGWANYQVRTKPFLSVFTSLALSLVYDLGLDKPLPEDDGGYQNSNTSSTPPRTMEERRAVLGCFLVTSVISSFLQKIQPMRWTAHMDECLSVLENEKDCLSDEVLVALTRLQRLANRATDLHASSLEEAATHQTQQQRQEQLVDLHLQLERVRAAFVDVSPRSVVLLHLHSIQLEMILPGKLITQLKLHDSHVLDMAFRSAISWFEVFLAIPPMDYLGFSFAVFTQLVCCLTTLLRLVILDHNLTWDHKWALDTANPLALLDHLIDNLEKVKDVAELNNGNQPDADVFSRSAVILRSLKAEWEEKLISSHDVPLAPTDSFTQAQETDMNTNLSLSGLDDDLLDINWFMDDFLPHGV